jgi:hypothetical protein
MVLKILVGGDQRVDQRFAVRIEGAQGADLIGAHQARVAGYVGNKNRRQPAFDARLLHRPSPRGSSNSLIRPRPDPVVEP